MEFEYNKRVGYLSLEHWLEKCYQIISKTHVKANKWNAWTPKSSVALITRRQHLPMSIYLLGENCRGKKPLPHKHLKVKGNWASSVQSYVDLYYTSGLTHFVIRKNLLLRFPSAMKVLRIKVINNSDNFIVSPCKGGFISSFSVLCILT